MKLKNNKYIMDLKNLTRGQAVGHDTKSKTKYPTAVITKGTDFSYIDNPGFADNRGIEAEIANAFFREAVTLNNYKYDLLLSLLEFKDSKNYEETKISFDVIISDCVIVEKSSRSAFIIDLTCDQIPSFPENIAKAENGKNPGDKGEDGKPGKNKIYFISISFKIKLNRFVWI